MPGRRQRTGKAIGPAAAAERRARFYDGRADGAEPHEQVRVRGEQLASLVRHAPPALQTSAVALALDGLTHLIDVIAREGASA